MLALFLAIVLAALGLLILAAAVGLAIDWQRYGPHPKPRIYDWKQDGE